MIKNFIQISTLFLVLFLFAGCFGSDSDEDEQPAYVSQAHVLLVNISSGKNITSLTLDGEEMLDEALLPNYYLHLWADAAVTGLDAVIFDGSMTFSILNQNIALGKVLYLEYDGSNVYFIVDDFSNYIGLLGSKSADIDVQSNGKSIQKMMNY
jgi:hypothetical protein